MTQTTNYGLKKPEKDDYYSDFIPEIFGNNMDTLDTILGGAKVSFLTAEDYDNLSAHPEKTVYFVTDNGSVTVYLGDVKLSGGTVAAGATIVQANVATGAAGLAAQIDESEVK
jgi:hypothetical protein